MLPTGAPVPDIFVTTLQGERQTLSSLLDGTPLLLAIYKSSCPVCQLTLPYLYRIAKGSLRVLAVSQDDERDTERFLQNYRLTLPSVLDRVKDRYPASNAFGVTHVPSLVLVEADGVVSMAASGFRKADLEALGQRSGVKVFQAEDNVPEWKAG